MADSDVGTAVSIEGVDDVFDRNDGKGEVKDSGAPKRKREDLSSGEDQVPEISVTAQLNDVKFQMREMMEAIRSLSHDVAGISKAMNGIMERLEKDVVVRLEKHDKGLEVMGKKMDRQTEKLEKTAKHVDKVAQDMEGMKDRVKVLEERAIEQEARSRRNNLLFFGIPEKEGEDCDVVIQNFLKEELKISDTVALQRVHRIGRKMGGSAIGSRRDRPRPMIAAFLDYKDREKVRSSRFHLRSPFGIGEDFPLEVRRAREKLLPELRELKQKGKKCAIVYPAKLLVDGAVVKTVSVETQAINRTI